MKWLLCCLLLSSCLAMERGRDELAGSVSGNIVIDEASGRLPVAYARLSLSPSTRVAMANDQGAFLIRELTPSRYTLRSVRDEDGDGRIDAGVWREVRIEQQQNAAGFYLAGEMLMLPTLSAKGCVTNDAALARIVAVHISADGTRTVEQTAVANGDGCYILARLISAAQLEVTAISADGQRSSTTTTIDLPPGEEQQSIVVAVPTLELNQRTSQRLLLRTAPAASSAVVQLRFARAIDGVFAAATVNGDIVTVDLSALPTIDLGPFDVTISTPEGNGFVAGVFAQDDIAWDLVLAANDRCARVPGRDCDNDQLLSLLYDSDGDPLTATWTSCAGACTDQSIPITTRSCVADDNTYDCDDDADGQADVTEPVACEQGDDFDGDGLCGSTDPFPLCASNTGDDPSCITPSDDPPPPPPVRDDFLPVFPVLRSPVAINDDLNELELGAAAPNLRYEVQQAYWLAEDALLTDNVLNFPETAWCEGGTTLRLNAANAEAGNGYVKCVYIAIVSGVPDLPKAVMAAVRAQIFTGQISNDIGAAGNTLGSGQTLLLHRDALQQDVVGASPDATRVLVDDGITWTINSKVDLDEIIVDTGGLVVVVENGAVGLDKLSIPGGQMRVEARGTMTVIRSLHTGVATPAEVLLAPGLVVEGQLTLIEGASWVGGIGGGGSSFIEMGATEIPIGAVAGATPPVTGGELILAQDAHFVSSFALNNVFASGPGILHASGTWTSSPVATELDTLEVGAAGLLLNVPAATINTVRFDAVATTAAVFDIIDGNIINWSGRWPGELRFSALDFRTTSLEVNARQLHVASGDVTIAGGTVDELVIDADATLSSSGPLTYLSCSGGGTFLDSGNNRIACP